MEDGVDGGEGGPFTTPIATRATSNRAEAPYPPYPRVDASVERLCTAIGWPLQIGRETETGRGREGGRERER